MKRRFTEEQKAFALRQAESGVPISEILRKLGIAAPVGESCRPRQPVQEAVLHTVA